MATLNVETKTKIEIEVTYPMYFKNHSETELVKMNSERDGIEIKKDSIKKSILSATDFYGMYRPATEEEFNKLFQECMTSISSLLIASDIKLLSQLEEDNISYFLFGEDACRVFEESGEIEDVLKVEGYAIHEQRSKDSIGSFLHAYDGWGAYIELTKDQYEYINNYLTNN